MAKLPTFLISEGWPEDEAEYDYYVIRNGELSCIVGFQENDDLTWDGTCISFFPDIATLETTMEASELALLQAGILRECGDALVEYIASAEEEDF